MGIEVMLGGLALGAVGNAIKSGGEKRAAQRQADSIQNASDQSAATQQQMYEQGQQATQPYAQAGTEALSQMQGLTTPEGQADFYNQYTQGPQYQQMQQQAEQSTLRNASATGGLRTGQSNVALASIAPQLMNNAYSQQMQGLQGLASQGAGIAGQAAGLATNVGTNVGGTQYQGGVNASAPQYQANTATSNMLGNTMGQLGGFALNQGVNMMAPTKDLSTNGYGPR